MKITYLSASICLILTLMTGRTFCQDKIYRTDGTVSSVQIISIERNTISYRLPGDRPGVLYSLSSSIVDSLSYANGVTRYYPRKEIPARTIKRNYVGTDLFNDAFGIANISFERLSASGTRGFTAELMIDLNVDQFYSVYNYWDFTDNFFLNYYPFYFFLKTGVSYYPFNCTLVQAGTFRIFTGPSLILGQFRKWDYDYDEIFEKGFAAVLSWNIGTKIYLADWLQIKADLDLSVIPFLVFNSPEVGITIGF